MAVAALSPSGARAVGISLGLIVGLILAFWLVALLWPAFRGAGMRGMSVIAANLTAMLGTAAGGKWASKKALASIDYSQIVVPYTVTVGLVFFVTGFVLLILLTIRMARNPRTA